MVQLINKAMEKGYTTGKGLGLGLPGAKRMMDEMDIQSEVDEGTKITVIKWLKPISDERKTLTINAMISNAARSSTFSL